ncbi:sugar transferase [Spiribacter insolitus]|uniref:Sugar transferase n=1 Tax=Spiribacter insolitus TaxID=3122417 RepID=A0ABV3T8M8_9GAMM
MIRRSVIRGMDLIFAIVGGFLLLPVFLGVLLVGFAETGSPLFRQRRVGRHEKPFILVKFRTMRPGTPSVATHLADQTAVTRLGGFLRRTKLDELPQLWNVVKGDMSLVGPRPCLPEQQDLIDARAARGVFHHRPGITGLAQIHGIDMSDPGKLAEWDARMLASFSIPAYFRYIMRTMNGAGRGDRIHSKE